MSKGGRPVKILTCDRLSDCKIKIRDPSKLVPSRILHHTLPVMDKEFIPDVGAVEIPKGSLQFSPVAAGAADQPHEDSDEEKLMIDEDSGPVSPMGGIVSELRQKAKEAKELRQNAVGEASKAFKQEQDQAVSSKKIPVVHYVPSVPPPVVNQNATVASAHRVPPPLLPKPAAPLGPPPPRKAPPTSVKTNQVSIIKLPRGGDDMEVLRYQASTDTGFDMYQNQPPTQAQLSYMDQNYSKLLQGLRFDDGGSSNFASHELLPSLAVPRGFFTQIIKKASVYHSDSHNHPGSIKIRANRRSVNSNGRRENTFYSPYELRRWSTVPLTYGNYSPEYSGTFTYSYNQSGLYFCCCLASCGSPAEVSKD